jgi:dTDP-4-dehydrorhamnose 3,5-epimerase
VRIEDAGLPGLKVITPARVEDARGWFSETFRLDALREAGVEVDWVQDNHSLSRAAGTVRGLHYQAPPRAQWKLVRCAAGAVLDVAVDARLGSPGFGRWVAVELSAANGRQLLIPAGFLHGFATLTPDAELLYKCSDTYSAEHDGAVAWDDPDLAVNWGPGADAAVLSDKDRAAPAWADWASPFTYGPSTYGSDE